MPNRLRSFTRRAFFYANMVLVFVFLLSCLAPYLHPLRWWFITFLGLGFPFLVVLLAAFLSGWLIIRRHRYAVICFIALIIGLKGILNVFAFHSGSFNQEKAPNSIRIATWNVARFIEMKRNNNKGSQTRLKMMEQIRQQNADIVCLQEFFNSLDSNWYSNINYISHTLNYPYWFFSHDLDADVHFTGSIIFSRYPIIDSGLIRYPRPTLPDALIHADIKVGSDTIRIYTTHLQSLQFGKRDYEKIGKIESAEDSLLTNSRTILSKIKKGFSFRSIQADLIHDVLGDSPYPILFCGDLNDIPTSYTYTRIKGKMQDAFLKKGFGIGRTFTGISPTLRIDYIFATAQFDILQIHRLTKSYSDHYMLVSDVQLRK